MRTLASDFNYVLSDFDEIVEYVAGGVGDTFIRVVTIAQDIIDNPTEYHGQQASMTAVKLAAYRTKIGTLASYYKIKTPETKRPSDRLTKDALLTMYNSLEELINTLKIQARQELS